jgi:hypothetical protein
MNWTACSSVCTLTVEEVSKESYAYGLRPLAFSPSTTPPASAKTREMENISGNPTFGDFATIRREGSMQDYRVQEYRLTSPTFIKCDVLRESLSE